MKSDRIKTVAGLKGRVAGLEGALLD